MDPMGIGNTPKFQQKEAFRDFIAVRRFLKSSESYKKTKGCFTAFFLLYLKKSNHKTNRNNEIVPLQTGKQLGVCMISSLQIFHSTFQPPPKRRFGFPKQFVPTQAPATARWSASVPYLGGSKWGLDPNHWTKSWDDPPSSNS